MQLALNSELSELDPLCVMSHRSYHRLKQTGIPPTMALIGGQVSIVGRSILIRSIDSTRVHYQIHSIVFIDQLRNLNYLYSFLIF